MPTNTQIMNDLTDNMKNQTNNANPGKLSLPSSRLSSRSQSRDMEIQNQV